MKKSKEAKVNLYNFNEHDDSIKNKKKKKVNKNTKKKVKSEEQDKIDISNEIIIGLTPKNDVKSENAKKKNLKQKNKKRKANSKENINRTKKEKQIPTKEQERIKKKRAKKLKVVKYSFLFICIIAAIIAIMTSPLFNIKNITVSGNEKITENEIISLSGITVNENIYKTIIGKSEEKILENPYIKSVEIKRKLPSEIEIIVEERKTSFMLEYGSGYVYVNNQGYILEISSIKLDVPIIQGAETETEKFVPGNRLCTNDLKKFDTIIKIMDIAKSNDIGSLISRIDIENSNNYILQFESEDKTAYLGDGTDLSTKLLNIKAILEKERGVAGEIFVNMDLKSNYPVFRQRV